ncbi:MAG: SusC/RagA family TonB-linked outer membrane protein [Cytophagales bacterium]
MSKFYTTLFALLVSLSVVAQQKITVRGKISDSATGQTMPGVNVVEKGTANGVSSDAEGNYAIAVAPDAVLVYTFIGYETLEISIGNREIVDVSLKENVLALKEVVVIGYGTQDKKDITGSIASISNKEFKDQPTTNLAQNLQGKLAGVNITTTSGTPGGALNVSIRGASNPLYVVDGIPMISESNSQMSTSFNLSGEPTGNGQSISTISDINPNDIESVEVLKDASAAAIYGSRGANGVVMITTKRGKEGKTKFNFNYYIGVQTPTRKIKFLNSQQFLELIKDARDQDLKLYNADNTVFGSNFDPSVLTQPLNYDASSGVNTVWLVQVLKDAPINNYEISATGGNEKTRFFVGGTYFDQSGIVVNSDYKRLSGRLNLDHQATDKLSFGANVMISHSRNRRSFNDNTYTGIITNALGADPLMPPYDINGNYSDYTKYHTNWLSDNPIRSANEIIPYTTSNRFLGTLFAEYKFNDALKFRTSWSTDYNNLLDETFFSPLTTDAEPVGGKSSRTVFEQLTWLNENILTYTKKIGKGSFSAIAGYTMQMTKASSSTINGQGFPTGIGLQNVWNAAAIVSVPGRGDGLGLVSYLTRVNYDYDGRFLVAATVRADGSSRFPTNNRYGVFPSGSIGWRISRESFFGNHALTDLKIRASYGLTGDQEIGNFQNVAYWQTARYNGISGLRPRNVIPSNGLTWQSNTAFNAGIDWELFGGRISGSIDYFKSNKTGLLSNDFIAGTTGFPTVTRNAGEIENKGWEFTINSVNVSTNKLRWNTSFNISFIQNRYVSLSNNGLLLSAYNDGNPTHIMQVGQSVGTFWAVKYAGVDPANGDALYFDQTGAKVNAQNITFDAAGIAGKAIPDYFGGLNNTVTYGDFDFLVATQFNVGNYVYNQIKSAYLNLGWSNDGGLDQVYANNSVEALNRWRKPGDITNIPRASFINQNYNNFSTQYIEDASFLRIRTVTLGYTLKPKNLNWFTSCRFYFTVQNLHVFTNYTGFDPEVSSTGSADPRTAGYDYAAYPQPRTYLVGFNLNF